MNPKNGVMGHSTLSDINDEPTTELTYARQSGFCRLNDCIRDPQVLQSVASDHQGAFASPRNAGVKRHAEAWEAQPTNIG